MSDLRAKIEQLDASAPQVAKAGGAQALGVLAELQRHSDPQVRLLVMQCYEQLGKPSATAAFVAGLDDADNDVALFSLDWIVAHADSADVSRLLEPLRSNRDDYLRGELALLIGRVGSRGNSETLRQVLAKERSPEVKDQIISALARLGERESRQVILQQLASESPDDRYEALQRVAYIGDKALLGHLLGLLDDHEPVAVVVEVIPDRKNLRICDAAVNVVAALSGAQFGFDATRLRNFHESEIQEVRQAVAAMPR